MRILCGILILFALTAGGCKEIGTRNGKASAPDAVSGGQATPADTVAVADVAIEDAAVPATVGFITINFEPDSITPLLNPDRTFWLAVPDDMVTERWLAETDIWLWGPNDAITLRCVGEMGDCWTVVTNETTAATHLLAKSSNLLFRTLEEGLLATSIETHSVQLEPSDEAPSMATVNGIFMVDSVMGDWLRVEAFYNSEIRGWVRWQRDNRVTIKPTLP